MKGTWAAAGFFSILLLTACDAADPTNQSLIHSPVSSFTLTATQEPSSTPSLSTDQPEATPDPGANCLSAGGNLERYEIPGDETLTGRIYTPPCYDIDDEKRYPVLYILHGDTETDQQWDELGLDDWADRLILEGEIPPLLIVMPREITWIHPRENPFGDQLVLRVLPWVDAHYRTLPDREYRALGGLSRGGNWAVRIGLLHWGLFGSIGAHSTPLFFGDLNRIPGWVEIIPESLVPRILLDIGDADSNLVESEEFHQLLVDLEVPHTRELAPGLHNEDYWRSQIEYYLRWYSDAWAGQREE